MYVDPASISSASVRPASTCEPVSTAANSWTAPVTSLSSSAPVYAPEVRQYLEILQHHAEVRPERVAEIAKLVNSGIFCTPEIAQQTAQLLLENWKK